MIAELHCHTSEYSACSHVNAVELIKRAHYTGAQAIVITDHHYQWNDDDLAKIKHDAGLPDYFNVLSGEEFKTNDFGDVLIYGLKETLKKQDLSLEEVRKQFPHTAIIWAHPYRHNKIPEKEKLLNPLLDGIEIFSSNYMTSESARALKDYHELKFTAIAGTDTHALSYTGTYLTIFDHTFSTIEEMVEEIKKGRCRPFFKEIPRSGTTDTKITEITIGPKTASERKKMIIKTYEDMDSWKSGERSFHIVSEILKYGFKEGSFRVSRPLDKDEKNLSLIEERVEGETLYKKLLAAEKKDAEKYLKLAAGWLAELHNLELRITPADEYLSIEKERLEYYLSGMYETKHPHTERVQLISDEVWSNEKAIIEAHPEYLVQSHGDFHLKNLFIGEDKKTNEKFIGAIDFNSSYQLLKAFDVGSFIAQHRNMFIDKPEIAEKAPFEIFYREYIDKVNYLNHDFEAQVELYKARTYLSIIYYLVKVGKGTSENFWSIMVAAERSLAQMSYQRT
ncbi:MAG: phosphotransferase [Ignavibacteriales bacterium]|nr:MAG: phosphotransferase [Ignavibacteriales bacterium]